MPIRVRRLPSNVQAERLKGGGASLSRFPTAGPSDFCLEQQAPEIMRRNSSPQIPTFDPVPALV
jgi:hypothetical protein